MSINNVRTFIIQPYSLALRNGLKKETDLAVVSSTNQNNFPRNLGKTNNKKHLQNKGKVLQKGVHENVKLQSNKLIIEINLKIQIESKSRFGTQAGVKALYEDLEIDLSQYEDNGKPITELSQEEAKELIIADGYYGVKQTAKRIADFATNAAGDNLDRLKVAREAVLKGFKDAEQSFGGSLPGISYETIDKALEMFDEKIRALGGSVVDVTA